MFLPSVRMSHSRATAKNSRSEDGTDGLNTSTLDAVQDSISADELLFEEEPSFRPVNPLTTETSARGPPTLASNNPASSSQTDRIRAARKAILSMSRVGAGGGKGANGLKGANWDFDPDLKLESKPSELFPPHPDLKHPYPTTDREGRQIEHFKTLQNKIHRGPLYTRPTKRDLDAPVKTFGEDQFNRQYGSNRKADMNPFTGVETYSQRMAVKSNDIPKLSAQPFDLTMFPKELWSTLQGTEGEEVKKHINRAMDKKAQMFGITNGKDTDSRTRNVIDKLNTLGGEEEAEEQDDEEANDEEEQDDEFDDESMGGDYDGEQYFDNGEEGSEASDRGGDGGGDGDF